MNDKDLYAQILGISSPWSVESVKLSLESNSVTVALEFDQSYSFTCPECSAVCPRHDKKPRRWRHLDTCQLDTVIDFKREVYELALSELARYLSRGIRMQQLAWGTPLDLIQSFYTGHDDQHKPSTKSDKEK